MDLYGISMFIFIGVMMLIHGQFAMSIGSQQLEWKNG